jgi:hypothetical protein
MKPPSKPVEASLLRPPFRIPSVAGTYPPVDATVQGVTVHYRLSDRGYYTSVNVQWSSPDYPGHKPSRTTVPDWTWRTWVPYTCRPSLPLLLRSAARRVWDISMVGLVTECEGQDPLPGL